MKQYRAWHAPFFSFFSKEFYEDVGLRWKGMGLVYLLVLVAILWLPGIMQIKPAMNFLTNELMPSVIDQIPVITIQDGEASIEKEQPYFIMDKDYEFPYMVIDTTGEITSPEQVDTDFLLTRTEWIMRQGEGQNQVYDLGGVEDVVLRPDHLYRGLDIFKALAMPTIYVFLVVASFVGRLIQALIYAAIGLAFVKILKADLEYETLVRLAIFAITPAIIIKAIFTLTGLAIPFAFVLYFVIAMWYLFFGVRAIAQVQHTPPQPPPMDVPQ